MHRQRASTRERAAHASKRQFSVWGLGMYREVLGTKGSFLDVHAPTHPVSRGSS